MLGAGAAAGLGSTAADKTCVSITLCHAFGMGSGVGGALTSGGAVVLPAADGIRGCGDPKQRAEVSTSQVSERLITQKCSMRHASSSLARYTQSRDAGWPNPQTLAHLLRTRSRVQVTAAVLLETHATLLIADSHIIKNMPAPSGAGASALRGGLVKVSSGTEIFDTGLEYAGVPLRSIGKRP